MRWIARDMIAWRARAAGDTIACVELLTGAETSYRALDALIARAVSAFAQWGDVRGQRIAMLCRNCLEFVILLHACERAGAIFVPLNWRLRGSELKVILEDCDPAVLVHDAEFEGAALEAAEGRRMRILRREDLRALVEAAREAGAARPETAGAGDAETPVILIYTSGTTGRPKGVIVTRKMAFFCTFNFITVAAVSARSVMLADAPIFHVLGLFAIVGATLGAGGRLILSERFEPTRTLKLLSDRALAVTHYPAAPAMGQALTQHPDFARSDLTRLVSLAFGGAPVPDALMQRFLDAGIAASIGFGMTESGTTLAMPLDRDAVRARPNSAGLPAPAMEVRVVRDDGSEAAPGEVGEIQLAGPAITPGYWNNPEATAKAFTEDGWFRTGDAAWRDEAGFHFIVDRWKDMYITGGENVYPAEVEAVIAALAGVADVGVVGVPHEKWGETGCAFVALAPGASLRATEIIAHCEQRLARYKLPASIRFTDTIPRNASGKIRKDALRAMYKETSPAD